MPKNDLTEFVQSHTIIRIYYVTVFIIRYFAKGMHYTTLDTNTNFINFAATVNQEITEISFRTSFMQTCAVLTRARSVCFTMKKKMKSHINALLRQVK